MHPCEELWQTALAEVDVRRALEAVVEDARVALALEHDGCVAVGDFSHMLDDMGIHYRARLFLERDVLPLRHVTGRLRELSNRWRQTSRILGHRKLFGTKM